MGMKKKRRDEVEYRKLNDTKFIFLYMGIIMHASANILPYLYTNAIRMLMPAQHASGHNNIIPTTNNSAILDDSDL